MLGVFALGGAGYAGTMFLGATDDLTLNPGYQPTQPVPFSHKIHAGELKMDCRYCHATVERSQEAMVIQPQASSEWCAWSSWYV